VPPADVLRFPVGVTEDGWQVASGQLRLHSPGGVLDPGGHRCGRLVLGHRVPSHPLRIWEWRIEVEGGETADEVGQKPTRSRGRLGCVAPLELAAWDKPLRMHGDALADDRFGQGHRTGKALLGEQSLRRNATARTPRLIDATLDDDLASVGEANTDYLGELGNAEENLRRLGSQDGAAPPGNPGRQI